MVLSYYRNSNTTDFTLFVFRECNKTFDLQYKISFQIDVNLPARSQQQ